MSASGSLLIRLAESGGPLEKRLEDVRWGAFRRELAPIFLVPAERRAAMGVPKELAQPFLDGPQIRNWGAARTSLVLGSPRAQETKVRAEEAEPLLRYLWRYRGWFATRGARRELNRWARPYLDPEQSGAVCGAPGPVWIDVALMVSPPAGRARPSH